MREITNNNQKDYSVETAEGGFHVIRAGKTETVDVNENKVEEYRSKGFEVGDVLAQKEPQGAAPVPTATEPPASQPDSALAKKPDAPATTAAPAKGADKKSDK